LRFHLDLPAVLAGDRRLEQFLLERLGARPELAYGIKAFLDAGRILA
jgi:hypothetical protein